MKKEITPKLKPSEGVKTKFSAQKVGISGLKPLTHKEDGTPLKDYEYLELLGRKVAEIKKTNANPSLPIDYQKYGYDKDCVQLAEQVCQAIDEGRPISEIEQYVKQSIDFNN